MDPLQPVLEKNSRDLLPIFLRIYIFVYVILTGSHYLLLPDDFAGVMTIIAGSSVVFGVAVQLLFQKPIVQDNAELIAFLLLFIMGVNSMTHLWFSGDIKQSTNVIFVMAIGGFVFPGYRPFYGILLSLLLTWGAIVGFGHPWTGDVVHFAFAIVLGAMFSIVLHTVRRNQLEQLSDLEETIEQLHQSERQVIAGESVLQNLMDNIPAGIIVRDEGTRVLYANSVGANLAGFSTTDIVGRTSEDDPLDLYYEDGDPVPEHERPIFQVLNENEEVVNKIYGIRRSDGEFTWALANAFAIEPEGTSQKMVVTAFVDITERLKAERQLRTLDKMSSIGVLAGGIAHDFNNLLTAIYGNVALAEVAIDDKEKAVSYLKRTNESIQLATNLTKQLLTFATGSDPVRDIMDIERVVREATTFALSGSSIAVSFDIDPDTSAVEVDAGQMQQAISNIILNAKQALEDSGLINISIRNTSDPESGEAVVDVTITDDGPGMDAEMLPKIFDPYFTTKPTGTGLGLATTHSIIVKHGGSITVDSNPGEGTSFSIRLPAAPEALEEPDYETIKAGPGESLDILVMDDEEVVLQTVSTLLEHLGHRVVGAHDGEEAVVVYDKRLKNDQRFDIVIMDLTVAGGMGGMEAAGEILKLDSEARLVVSSGYSEGAEMARFKELGFCARLEKPFRTTDLEKMIAEVKAGH